MTQSQQNNTYNSNQQNNANNANGDARSTQSTPAPWDNHNPHLSREYRSSDRTNYRDSRDASQRDSREVQRERIERLGMGQQQHMRNGSIAGTVSTSDFAEQHHPRRPDSPTRRHDYDVHSMETDVSSRAVTKNPIPPPTVTLRSEFPTMTRSRQQQSLTCLVTIEVPAGKWQGDPEDMSAPPPVPPLPQDEAPSLKSPVGSQINHSRGQSYEAPEALEEITEELRTRVDNWHGLEFSRCVDTLRSSYC